jgi:hypothetical protein
MRRLTAWIGGTAVGVAAYRFLRRGPAVAQEPTPEPEPDVRAEELREKLAESRASEHVAVPVLDDLGAEPVPEDPPAQPEDAESPEDRRQRVHEEGRAALDEMKPE